MTTAEVVGRASARPDPGRVAAQKSPAATRQASKKSAEPAPCISPEERFQMISEAAYFRAEQRGFLVGDDLADWLAAEAEVDALLLGDEAIQSSR